MSQAYSIGELAVAVGIPVSTIRHYEREGLLVPDGRTESNYRIYGQRSLDRLRFVRAAQASGLALEDVRALLSIRDGSTAPCPDVRQLLARRLGAIDERLTDLRRMRKVLRSSLAACEEQSATGRCRVIERLAQTAAERSRRPARTRTKKI